MEKELAMIVKDLVSCEFTVKDQEKIPVLNLLSLEIGKGDIFGLSASRKEELTTLVQILGNMRPYLKGMVKLSFLGTKLKKRTVVENIFYLDSPLFLYNNMTLLEQLVFVLYQRDSKKKPDEVQREALDIVSKCNLKDYVLVKIKDIPYNIRFLIGIIVGLLTNSSTLVVDLVETEFGYEEAKIFKSILDNYALYKTVVLATNNRKLLSFLCTKVAYILDGKLNYLLDKKEVEKDFKNVAFMMEVDEPKEAYLTFVTLYPQYKNLVYIDDNLLLFKEVEVEEIITPNFLVSLKRRGVNISNIKFISKDEKKLYEEYER